MSTTFSSKSNFGDIIYSLPYCIAKAKDNYESKFNYEITTNYGAHYNTAFDFSKEGHPCGKYTMTDTVAKMLVPLLEAQSYIDTVYVTKYPQAGVRNKFNLENFRACNLFLDKFSITRWYQAVEPNMYPIEDYKQWLFPTERRSEFRDNIICCRSMRYWAGFSLKELRNYAKRIVFIGVDEEYESFQEVIDASVERYEIKDFLEALNIISSCKLFFGNQTGLTSLAVALGGRVHHIIETNRLLPNVITPTGTNIFNEIALKVYLTKFFNK